MIARAPLRLKSARATVAVPGGGGGEAEVCSVRERIVSDLALRCVKDGARATRKLASPHRLTVRPVILGPLSPLSVVSIEELGTSQLAASKA